jgi:MFS transporter, DHA3 family, macrolide efflux protein
MPGNPQKTWQSAPGEDDPAGIAVQERNLRYYQLAALLNSVGTRCGQLAVAWWALAETGRAATFAVLVALGSVADVVARGALGWLGDRYDRKALIAGCHLTSVLVVLVMVGCHLTGFYDFAVVAMCLVVLGLCNGLREPLQLTVIRDLVGDARTEFAVRRRSVVYSISSMLGPVIAGVLLSTLGVLGTLMVNAGMVAAGLVATLLLRLAAVERPVPSDRVNPLLAWMKGTVEGFRVLVAVKSELHLAWIGFAVSFALFPLFAVLVPALVYRRYPDHVWVIGVIEAAFAVGLFAGSSGLVHRINRILARPVVVFAGFSLTGLCMISTGLAAGWAGADHLVLVAVATPAMLAGGIGLTMATINTSTLRALASPARVRNRISATAAFVSGLAVPLGIATGGQVVTLLGDGMAMVLLGCVILLAVVVGSRSGHLTRTLGLSTDDMVDAYDRLYLAPAKEI